LRNDFAAYAGALVYAVRVERWGIVGMLHKVVKGEDSPGWIQLSLDWEQIEYIGRPPNFLPACCE
jgi:hypothetical protein